MTVVCALREKNIDLPHLSQLLICCLISIFLRIVYDRHCALILITEAHLDPLKSLQNFDWRSLKKYTSPRAIEDLNTFLEGLPNHVSKSMLIAAGLAWGLAGGTGVYTTIQLQKLTALRVELEEAKAINPTIPTIEKLAVSSATISKFVENIDPIYSGLSIKAQGSSITITGSEIRAFGQFREAVGHVLNGGQEWRVDVDKMCIGRECDKFPLSVSLKVHKVSVSNPN